MAGEDRDEVGPAGSRKNDSRTAAAGQTEERRGTDRGAAGQQKRSDQKKKKVTGNKIPKLRSAEGVLDTQPPELREANRAQKKVYKKLFKKWNSHFVYNLLYNFCQIVFRNRST